MSTKLLDLIGNNPFCWNIQYNILGWMAQREGSNCWLFISEVAALRLIQWVKNAHTYHNPANKLP